MANTSALGLPVLALRSQKIFHFQLGRGGDKIQDSFSDVFCVCLVDHLVVRLSVVLFLGWFSASLSLHLLRGELTVSKENKGHAGETTTTVYASLGLEKG